MIQIQKTYLLDMTESQVMCPNELKKNRSFINDLSLKTKQERIYINKSYYVLYHWRTTLSHHKVRTTTSDPESTTKNGKV